LPKATVEKKIAALVVALAGAAGCGFAFGARGLFYRDYIADRAGDYHLFFQDGKAGWRKNTIRPFVYLGPQRFGQVKKLGTDEGTAVAWK